MKHDNGKSDDIDVFALAERVGLGNFRPVTRQVKETITRTITASLSCTLTTTAVSVVPNVQVDFCGAAPLHLEQPAPAPIQAPPVREKPSVPAGSRAKTKIDKESREVLRYISEDFVFLSGKAPVAYHIASGDEMGKESFRHYCAKHYGDVVLIDNEKRVDAGTIWWEWNDPERRVVRRIVMEPTEKDESEDDPEVYNRWHVLKHTMVEPDLAATDKDIAIILQHLLYIAGGDVVGVAFFLNWLAWLYLHPGAKMPTAILMYSKYGRVGKSMLHRLLATIYGPTMVASTTGKALSKSFDDVVEHKRLVVVNEMASAEKKDGYETFKNMVSEPVVTFEGKGRAAKEVANSAHYIVTTNNDDALPLMENDGRVLVMRCLEERKPDAYYKVLGEWIDGPGPALLAGMFEKWTFTADWDPHAPVPQTEASRAMQLASRPAHELALRELVEEGKPPFDKDLGKLSALINQLQTTYGNDLLNGFRINHKSLPKAFQNIGVKKIEHGTSSAGMAYCWRNYDFWNQVTLADMRAYRDGGADAPRPAPTAVQHGVRCDE